MGEAIEIRSAAFALMDRPKEQFKAWFWKDNYSRWNKQKTVTPDFIHYDADTQALRFYFPRLEYHYFGKELRREQIRGGKVQGGQVLKLHLIQARFLCQQFSGLSLSEIAAL